MIIDWAVHAIFIWVLNLAVHAKVVETPSPQVPEPPRLEQPAPAPTPVIIPAKPEVPPPSGRPVL